MRSSHTPARYVLVPRAAQPDPLSGEGSPDAPQPSGDDSPAGAGAIRRYSLARVGVSRRSALGEDRHARLEDVAGRRRRSP